MKDFLVKIGLYAMDLGVSLLGVGAIGLAVYGAWNLTGMAASALTGGILMYAAIAGIVIVCAGGTLGLSVGMKKIFKWTAEGRNEIRKVERLREYGREYLGKGNVATGKESEGEYSGYKAEEVSDGNSVLINNAVPIEDDEICREIEGKYSGNVEEVSDKGKGVEH